MTKKISVNNIIIKLSRIITLENKHCDCNIKYLYLYK